MMIEVLAYVVDGWRPFYLIDVKKFDKEDNTIPVDGYAEIANSEGFQAYRVAAIGDIDEQTLQIVYEFEDESYQKINRDFIIRAKRSKTEEWNKMKYKMYRIDE